MADVCWIQNCKHNNNSNTCSFFNIPKDSNIRKRWLNLINHVEEPKEFSSICSCHFPDGKKENGPQILSHRIKRTYDGNIKEETSAEFQMVLIPETPADFFENETHQILQDTVKTETSEETENDLPSTSERNDVKNKHNKREPPNFNEISNDNKLISIYTGLPNPIVFDSLYELVENIPVDYYLGWNVKMLSRKDHLFLTLMMLRQNFPPEDLAFRFNVPQNVLTNITLTWIHVLHEILFEQLMCDIPSRYKNKMMVPDCSEFTNCRIILDCIEIASTISNESLKHTWKALIGVAPNGLVTYVSNLYPVSVCDKKIIQHCGVLEKMKTGDVVLTEKDFLLDDILPVGVSVKIKCTETNAHVKKAVERMRHFKILNDIPHTLIPHAMYIVQVVGALINLQYMNSL